MNGSAKDIGIRLTLSVMVIFMFTVVPVSFVYAQTFEEQLRAAADDLDPEARAEFENIISDPEIFLSTLEDMNVPLDRAIAVQQMILSGEKGSVAEKNKNDHKRVAKIDRLMEKQGEFRDRIDSKIADKIEKAAEEAAKVAAKLAAKAEEAEAKAAVNDAKADGKAEEEAAKEDAKADEKANKNK